MSTHSEDCLDANDDTSVLKGKCICGGEKFRIIRFFSDGRPAKLVKVVSSLYIAQLHCGSPLTSGTLRSGVKWFDGYKGVQ